MSPYRVQYTESESDIKNYNFLYTNTKQAKTLSKNIMFFSFFGIFQKSKNFKNPIFYFALLVVSEAKTQYLRPSVFLFGVC